MLIGYLGRPGRVKHVCGEEIRFVDDGSGRLVADVKSPEAIAVLLEPHNANLFYAVDPPQPLERSKPSSAAPKSPEPVAEKPQDQPAAPGRKKPGRKSAAEKELIAAAATVLDNDADVVLELLASIEDASLRDEMRAQEQAGQARAVVLEALG